MSQSEANGGLAALAPSVSLYRAATYVPVAATLVLVVALSFTSGGYFALTTTPWAVAWLAVVLVWVLWARPPARPPAATAVAAGALGLLTLWTGVSILWSVGPDLSWVAFNYAGLYLAAAFALAWGGTGRLHLWAACGGYLVCAAAVAVYAYLGKVLPDVVTHANEYARLAAPVGYWNVLAVMLVMAVPLALALAARRGLSPYLRAAAAALLAFLLITLFFTFSRGGFAAALVALVVYFAATRERLSSLVSLLIALAPVALVLFKLRDLETLFSTTTDDALRTAQGHALGIWTIAVVVAPFVLQLGASFVHRRLDLRAATVRWVGVGVLIVVLAVCLVGPLVYLQTREGVAHWMSTQYSNFINGPNTEGGDTADRVLVVVSNGRVDLYRTSLRQVEHTPWLGTGAGTFAFTNERFRETSLVVKHAHSQWFNTLSELGFIGLAFFTVFVVAMVAALVLVLVRRSGDPERGLLAGCAAAAAAFLFHISGDWDWDMAAVTLAFLLLAVTASCYRGRFEAAEDSGGRSAADLPERRMERRAAVKRSTRRLGWPAAILWAGLLAVLLASWLPPFLSQRAENQALAAVSRGAEAVALSRAQRAHALNPLAADPLITLSAVEESRGRPRAALAALRQAARLQPENYYVHYQLGILLYTTLGRTAAAEREFRRALQLNPLHDLSRQQIDMLGGR